MYPAESRILLLLQRVKICRRGTLYPWTGFPGKSVLVCRLLRDKERAALFHLCTMEARDKPRAFLENPWFST